MRAVRSDHIGCVGLAEESCCNSTLHVTLSKSEIRGGILWKWRTLTHAKRKRGRVWLRNDQAHELVNIIQRNAAPKMMEWSGA